MNTDLSPGLPPPTARDLVLDPSATSRWAASDSARISSPDTGLTDLHVVGPDPILRYRAPLDACLADYSHFMARMAASPDIFPRAMQLFYLLDGDIAFAEERSFFIPLLADADAHTYTYDLDLVGARPGQRLTGFRLDPVGAGSPAGESRVRIADLRLVRRPGPTRCSQHLDPSRPVRQTPDR